MSTQNLCNDGRCKQVRMGEIHEAHDSENDGIFDSDKNGFDDIIINQTNARIVQEFENFSSLETKSGIIIAATSAIFVLILSPTIFQNILQQIHENIGLLITFAFGISGFAAAFALSIVIVWPRKKLSLLDPRKMNNEFAGFELSEVKRQIRHNLILGFEELQRERKKDTSTIGISFIMMGVGSIGIILTYIIN